MPPTDLPPQLPPEVLEGIELFNAGQFYACHDSLEKAWVQEKRSVKKLYQGILQIGVALYHERNANRRGATRLLQSGMDKLKTFAPSCLGIDISSFMDEAMAIHNYFPSHCERLPETMYPKIRITPSAGHHT